MNLDFTGSTLFLVLLLFAAGLVCIIKGGDFFVDAATWIAEASGFPKFIIGFVAASLVFRILQSNGLFTADAKGKLAEPGVAKMFSTVFFSLAFVRVGLDTRLKEIVSKENRYALWAFLVAQTFNIVVTLVIALVLFGVLKPMLA